MSLESHTMNGHVYCLDDLLIIIDGNGGNYPNHNFDRNMGSWPNGRLLVDNLLYSGTSHLGI